MTSRKIHVAYITDELGRKKNIHATALYRIWYPTEYLESHGFDVKYFNEFRIAKAGWIDNPFLRQADVCIFGQIGDKDTLECAKALKANGKKILQDCDDLYYDKEPNMAVRVPKAQLEATKGIQRLADACTVVSPFLGTMLEKFVGVDPKKIHYIPNMIPYKLQDALYMLTPKLPKKEGVVTIGFMGAQNHLPDLNNLLPILAVLKAKYQKKIEFHVVGLDHVTFANIILDERYEQSHKNLALAVKEQMDMLGFVYHGQIPFLDFYEKFMSMGWDIGLAPLCNTRTDKSKSYLKYLDYGMARIPAVYRNISPFTDAITEGYNGLLANSSEEWITQISRLIDDPKLRKTIVDNSVKDIKNKHDIEMNGCLWAEVIDKVLPKP
jgi:glycosyltransferase involved in cell wall biosynthesis